MARRALPSSTHRGTEAEFVLGGARHIVEDDHRKRMEVRMTTVERTLIENTDVVHLVNNKLDALQVLVAPSVEAFDSMRAGIKTIGTIGKWGKRALKAALYCTAGVMAIKTLFGTGNLSDAMGAFWRTLGASK